MKVSLKEFINFTTLDQIIIFLTTPLDLRRISNHTPEILITNLISHKPKIIPTNDIPTIIKINTQLPFPKKLIKTRSKPHNYPHILAEENYFLVMGKDRKNSKILTDENCDKI